MAKRPRKLDAFSINVQRYIHKIMHKIAFLGYRMGHYGQYKHFSERLRQKKLCSRISSRECQFCSYNSKLAVLSHLLGRLGVTYAIYLLLVGKLVVDFVYVTIEQFSLDVTALIGRNWSSLKEVDHFGAEY